MTASTVHHGVGSPKEPATSAQALRPSITRRTGDELCAAGQSWSLVSRLCALRRKLAMIACIEQLICDPGLPCVRLQQPAAVFILNIVRSLTLATAR